MEPATKNEAIERAVYAYNGTVGKTLASGKSITTVRLRMLAIEAAVRAFDKALEGQD